MAGAFETGAFEAIGAALRGIVNAGNQVLPNGLFRVTVFVLLVIAGWTLAKRLGGRRPAGR
ncbi:hypothetical protein BH20CHL7_BH20CHL7_06960 [soil metagenome]